MMSMPERHGSSRSSRHPPLRVNAEQSLSAGPPGRDRLTEIVSELLVASDAVHASEVPRIGPGQAKLKQNLWGRCTGKKPALPCRVGRKALTYFLSRSKTHF